MSSRSSVLFRLQTTATSLQNPGLHSKRKSRRYELKTLPPLALALWSLHQQRYRIFRIPSLQRRGVQAVGLKVCQTVCSTPLRSASRQARGIILCSSHLAI